MLTWPAMVVRLLLGLVAGGIFGYVLHRTVGCQGGCPLIATPLRAVVLWSFAGAVIAMLSWRN